MVNWACGPVLGLLGPENGAKAYGPMLNHTEGTEMVGLLSPGLAISGCMDHDYIGNSAPS